MKWGTRYGPEYVNRLHDGLRRNTSRSFRFLCFTDDSSGVRGDIECRPLPNKEVVGWWHKPWLFSQEAGLQGTAIYFDLDTVIAGNIDEIFGWRGRFIVNQSVTGRLIAPDIDDANTMMMGWCGGWEWGERLWEMALAGGPGLYKNMKGTGDQGFINGHRPPGGFTYWQKYLSDRTGIISYKATMLAQNQITCLPRHTSIVCFHGTPRPHEVADLPWMKEHWREGL